MRRISNVLLVVAMVVSMLAGCAEKTSTNDEKTGYAVKTNTNDEKTGYAAFPSKLTAEKIATLDMNDKSMNVAEGGIYYHFGDKYGVMSFDGKHDTGAIYSYCTPKKNFFIVATEVPETEEMTPENMNHVGVIDVTGKVIVPEEYASVDVLNEHFIKVCKVSEQTESKDDALLFSTDRSIAIFANDDDTFFKGNWYVFDAETGNKMESVTGTRAYAVTAYGNYIKYSTDDGEKKCVNANEEALPEDAELLDDGSYIVEKDGKGSAYDTDGNKLFDYLADDFEITYCAVGSKYYIAKKNVDGKYRYIVVDKEGKIVSAEFEEYPNLYGECLFVENKLYDFEGNVVCDGEFKRASIDKFTNNAIMLTKENDDATIVIDGKTVFAQFKASEDISVGSSDFTANKKTDDGNMYYSYKDKDYTLKGSSYGPWVVKAINNDGSSKLVDTISGDTLISNYKSIISTRYDGTEFYAFGENKDGTVDVYLIK